jgi:hypothetical protein
MRPLKKTIFHSIVISGLVSMIGCTGTLDPFQSEKFDVSSNPEEINVQDAYDTEFAPGELSVAALQQPPETCGRHSNFTRQNTTDSSVAQRRLWAIQKLDARNFDIKSIPLRTTTNLGLVAHTIMQSGGADAAKRTSDFVLSALTVNGKPISAANNTGLFGLLPWTTLAYLYDCKLTSQAQTVLKAYFKTALLDGGFYSTDNLYIYKIVNSWILSQMGYESKALSDAKDSLISRIKEAYQFGPGDWASRPYAEKNLVSFLPIMMFHKDPWIASAARLAFENAMARYAAVWNDGHTITYSPRDYNGLVKKGPNGFREFLWMYFGGQYAPSGMRTGAAGHELWATVFPYDISPAIMKSVRQQKTPVREIRSTSSSIRQQAYLSDQFGMYSLVGEHDGTPSFAENVAPGVRWNTGDTGSLAMALPHSADDRKNSVNWVSANINANQWLQSGATQVLVVDRSFSHGNPLQAPNFILGHYSATGTTVDTRCASVLCNNAYRLFLAKQDQPFIAITSNLPFNVDTTRKEFKMNLETSIAAAGTGTAAIEVMSSDQVSGANFSEKLENFIRNMSSSTLTSGSWKAGSRKLPTVNYTDRTGKVFHLRYHPDYYFDFAGAEYFNSINAKLINPNSWVQLETSFSYQASSKCPMYLRDPSSNNGWTQLWDDKQPIFKMSNNCQPNK